MYIWVQCLSKSYILSSALSLAVVNPSIHFTWIEEHWDPANVLKVQSVILQKPSTIDSYSITNSFIIYRWQGTTAVAFPYHLDQIPFSKLPLLMVLTHLIQLWWDLVHAMDYQPCRHTHPRVVCRQSNKSLPHMLLPIPHCIGLIPFYSVNNNNMQLPWLEINVDWITHCGSWIWVWVTYVTVVTMPWYPLSTI